MKKEFFLIACLLMSAVLLSACEVKTQKSIIKAKRRLEQYLPSTDSTTTQSSKYVDLSEGPKLRYNANFGPNDLNFDFKVVNSY